MFLSDIYPPISWHRFHSHFDPQIFSAQEAVLLQDKPLRKVYLIDNFVFKAFKAKPLRRDQAWKEASLGLFLEGLAPKVWAYGYSPKWRFVVTEFVQGLSLGKFLEDIFPFLSRGERQIFFRKLALFLAALIKRGVFQPDFHLENILLEPNEYKFYLLDLHRARQIEFSSKMLCSQWAYLLPPLLSKLSWWEIGRLTYAMSELFPSLRTRSLRLCVQKKAFSLMRKHFQKREKKCFSKLYRESTLRETKISTQPLSSVFFERLPASSLWIKDSRTTKSVRIKVGEKFYLRKAYHLRGPFHALVRMLIGSRARKAFFNALRLSLRGIRTITPLALWERRFTLKGPQGILVYPWVSEARRDWRTYWASLDEPQKIWLTERLVRFLWEMHERGVFHGDAKITNFVLFKDGRVGIIDLDNVVFQRGALSSAKRLQDLAALACSLERLEAKSTFPLVDHIFSFYSFLFPEFSSKYYPRFIRYISKLQRKRLKKYKKRFN